MRHLALRQQRHVQYHCRIDAQGLALVAPLQRHRSKIRVEQALGVPAKHLSFAAGAGCRFVVVVPAAAVELAAASEVAVAALEVAVGVTHRSFDYHVTDRLVKDVRRRSPWQDSDWAGRRR